MLIVLGGFLGSGRKMLARQLAAGHGLYLYDSRQKKLRGSEMREGVVHEVIYRATTDEMCMVEYRAILADMPRLSKMYPDTVIQGSFHLTAPREYFLSQAAKYFDKTVFVWIDSDESHVVARLREMQGLGMIKDAERSLRRRRKTAEQFQPLDSGLRVFTCVRADAAEAEALWNLVASM